MKTYLPPCNRRAPCSLSFLPIIPFFFPQPAYLHLSFVFICCYVSSLLFTPFHQLPSPLIFRSFSSPHHSVLPPLTPIFPLIIPLTSSLFGHSSSICLKWALSVSSLCHLSPIPPSSAGPNLWWWSLILCSLSISASLSIHLSPFHNSIHFSLPLSSYLPTHPYSCAISIW